MRTRLRRSSVYSLSAIDLFASAMGAFIIITLILMPDYQKEVRLEGHLAYLESLAAESRNSLAERTRAADNATTELRTEQSRALELQAERDIVRAELNTTEARLRARVEPPPPPVPADAAAESSRQLVTFRFLGLKTATLASNRTAQGASEGLNRGLQVAFRSGAVMGLVVVGFASGVAPVP